MIASARSLLTPFWDEAPCVAMPVFSSGQTVRQPPETLRRIGSTDLIYAAGGGVMGHPDGPAAGFESLREAWNAVQDGNDLETRASTSAPLAAALEAFPA